MWLKTLTEIKNYCNFHHLKNKKQTTWRRKKKYWFVKQTNEKLLWIRHNGQRNGVMWWTDIKDLWSYKTPLILKSFNEQWISRTLKAWSCKSLSMSLSIHIRVTPWDLIGRFNVHTLDMVIQPWPSILLPLKCFPKTLCLFSSWSKSSWLHLSLMIPSEC